MELDSEVELALFEDKRNQVRVSNQEAYIERGFDKGVVSKIRRTGKQRAIQM